MRRVLASSFVENRLLTADAALFKMEVQNIRKLLITQRSDSCFEFSYEERTSPAYRLRLPYNCIEVRLSSNSRNLLRLLCLFTENITANTKCGKSHKQFLVTSLWESAWPQYKSDTILETRFIFQANNVHPSPPFWSSLLRVRECRLPRRSKAQKRLPRGMLPSNRPPVTALKTNFQFNNVIKSNYCYLPRVAYLVKVYCENNKIMIANVKSGNATGSTQVRTFKQSYVSTSPFPIRNNLKRTPENVGNCEFRKIWENTISKYISISYR